MAVRYFDPSGPGKDDMTTELGTVTRIFGDDPFALDRRAVVVTFERGRLTTALDYFGSDLYVES